MQLWDETLRMYCTLGWLELIGPHDINNARIPSTQTYRMVA